MSGRDSRRRVVVTGMGIVSPLGNDVETAFARLKTFENCVEALPELAEYEGLNLHPGTQRHGAGTCAGRP